VTRRTIAALVAAGLLAGCGTNHYDRGPDALSRTPRFPNRGPVFDCQEDDLMVWLDRETRTAVCVNEAEYAHAIHALAGHIAVTGEDRRIFPLLPADDHEGMAP
jgi:hypothetical protein